MSGFPGCFGCAAPFPGLQIWLAHALHGHAAATAVMTSKYGWPICETLHFLGLSLLVGTVGMFDLRVLGVAKNVPMTALHRLAPFALAGFAVNALTGVLFLMAFPDQYIFQWPFLLKLALIGAAGLNALVFNVLVMRRLEPMSAGDDAPTAAKIMCALSIALWIAVIVAGRFLAFYKPVFTTTPP